MINVWKDDDLAQADFLYCMRKGFFEFVKMMPFGNEETEKAGPKCSPSFVQRALTSLSSLTPLSLSGVIDSVFI